MPDKKAILSRILGAACEALGWKVPAEQLDAISAQLWDGQEQAAVVAGQVAASEVQSVGDAVNVFNEGKTK